MEESKELLNLSVRIMFDQYALSNEIGLNGRPDLFSIFENSYRLKNSSYFEVKKSKIYLSQKGRIEIIKRIIENKKSKNNKWDNYWRAVIFDIPEASKRERNFLRKELKWMGFKELQHSVWITPYDIEKELFALLKLWHKDFTGDIRFLKINKITEDKDLKNFFNL